jgi:hypothetical protein
MTPLGKASFIIEIDTFYYGFLGSLLVSVVVNRTVHIGNVFMAGWYCLIDYVGRIVPREVYCAISQRVAVLVSAIIFQV